MMSKLFAKLMRKPQPTNSLEDFFAASKEDQQRVLKDVMRKVNDDQNEVLRRYDEMVAAGKIAPIK